MRHIAAIGLLFLVFGDAPCWAESTPEQQAAERLMADFVLACNLEEWDKALGFFAKDFTPDKTEAAERSLPAQVVDWFKTKTSQVRKPLVTVLKTEFIAPAATAGKAVEGRSYLKRTRVVIEKAEDGKSRDVWKHEFLDVRFQAVESGGKWTFSRLKMTPRDDLGDLDRAVQLAQFDALLAKGFPAATKASILANKAAFLLDQKDYKAAEAVCKEGLALGVSIQGLHAVLAGALKGQKRYAEAIEQYREAAKFKDNLMREQDAMKRIEECEALMKEQGKEPK
jgi:tetratricopeptide (TPR) repeat protein